MTNHGKQLSSAILVRGGRSPATLLRSAMTSRCIGATPIAASQLLYLHTVSSNTSRLLLPECRNVHALSGVAPVRSTTHIAPRPTFLPQLQMASTTTSSPCSGPKVLTATDKAEGDENSILKAEHVKMLDQVRAAQDAFATMSQEDADRIFTHVASVANKSRVPLAKMAAEETRMGVFEDKVLKNGLAW